MKLSVLRTPGGRGRPRSQRDEALSRFEYSSSQLGHFPELFGAGGAEVKWDCALDHFFECYPSRFMFSGIDFDAWVGAALQLLAAFRR